MNLAFSQRAFSCGNVGPQQDSLLPCRAVSRGRVFPRKQVWQGFQMVTLIRVGKTIIGNGICFVGMFAGDWLQCLAPAR